MISCYTEGTTPLLTEPFGHIPNSLVRSYLLSRYTHTLIVVAGQRPSTATFSSWFWTILPPAVMNIHHTFPLYFLAFDDPAENHTPRTCIDENN